MECGAMWTKSLPSLSLKSNGEGMLSKISNYIEYCEGEGQGTVHARKEDVTWLGDKRCSRNILPKKATLR